MDHAIPDREVRAPAKAPKPAEERAPAPPSSEDRILELQRTAGNRAVAQLMTVQRHSLDPQRMDEQGEG